MNHSETTAFLEETVSLLVEHFGADRVRAAVAKVSNGVIQASEMVAHAPVHKPARQVHLNVTSTLEQLRSTDEEKHRLLSEFYTRLKDRKILPDSQDIRHFALNIGLTEIRGKSRRDMIGALIRFLSEEPTQQLQIEIERAEGISEQNRRQGFSVLADKLMGGRQRP